MASSTTKSARRAPRSGKISARMSADGVKRTKTLGSKRSASGIDEMRLELRSLKKRVLLQIQQLLRSKAIGPIQLNSLLSDSLKVALSMAEPRQVPFSSSRIVHFPARFASTQNISTDKLLRS